MHEMLHDAEESASGDSHSPQESIVQDYALSHEWGCSPEGRYAMRMALPERVRFQVDQTVLDDWCEAPEAVRRR